MQPSIEISSKKVFPKSPVVLLLGAPFSGKGTQAHLLNSRLSVPVLQSGHLFRQEAKSGSDIGLKMLTYMNSGVLIPDDLTIDLITKTLCSPSYEAGVIIDGYPRNLDNLTIFENILKMIDMEIDAVIFLDADYEVLIDRVGNRLACQNCGFSHCISDHIHCCDSPLPVKRSDDTIEKFMTRYQVFKDETLPLINEIKQKYCEKFIHITPDIIATTNKGQLCDYLIEELSGLPFRRVIPSCDPYEFEKPFYWLLNFVKSNKLITKDDLKFYLDWALECNKPDQTGLLRRVIFVATTSKPKFLEYRKTFLLYGIEVIRFPVIDDENIIKMLLSEFDSTSFSAIALLSDCSNLYKPVHPPATIEDIESNKLHLCSMKNGVHCTNYCVLTVTYCTLADDMTSILKTYKLIDHVDGIIKTENNKISPFAKVFGWDGIFFVKGLGKSYHELRELGFKKSARDRVLSTFLSRHVHYKTTRNLKFNTVSVKSSVDFSINLTEFFSNIKEYNLEMVKEYGFMNIWRHMLQSGVFLKAAAFRRIGIYWNPGVNGGLPLVKKADHIHEITFMAHDIGHQLLPDLVFTGNNSFAHKRVYIMWRMMSEAFTMALTDMVYIDALNNSGVEYDYTKRKIYPLFKDLGMNVSPKTNPKYMETIRKIVHANFTYCLRGDDSEYRELIASNKNLDISKSNTFANLEAFKTKYAPFFVEDFRWTEQNYNSMVTTRSLEARKWWAEVQDLNQLLDDFKIKSIDDFMNLGFELDVDSGTLLEKIFTIAFDETIKPILEAQSEKYNLKPEDEPYRKFRAFTRWMIGQLSICFKYDFIPESGELIEKISSKLKGLDKRIDDVQIMELRGIYELYLKRLMSLSLISSDDYATFSQVYPLFDPFFVTYDKSINEYEPLSLMSGRILDDQDHHFSSYHQRAERILGRNITSAEKNYLNTFYILVENCGGKIVDGLFVVDPGVLILTETENPSPDSAISILIAGMSVETSLEFIAHHETKVARLTSSKTKAMNLPLFEINNYDQTMMKLVERALKSRLDVATTPGNYENINLTLPGAKSSVASFCVTLKDIHSILIGRLGNPRGNETSVIKIASKICEQLHAKYPKIIKPLDYYLSAKNHQKYVSQEESNYICPGETRILPNAWKLFDALNIPRPPSDAPSTAAFISIADFNARVTYLSFSKSKISFADSVNFVKNIVVKEGHASILSSYQVVHNGESKRTKELFTQLGWDDGLESLLSYN